MRKDGYMSKHGYVGVKDLSIFMRHKALAKIVESGAEPPMGLFRRLNLLMVFFKNKDPKLSQIFKSNRDWVKKKYLSKEKA
jgi:hypothetical protein